MALQLSIGRHSIQAATQVGAHCPQLRKQLFAPGGARRNRQVHTGEAGAGQERWWQRVGHAVVPSNRQHCQSWGLDKKGLQHPSSTCGESN